MQRFEQEDTEDQVRILLVEDDEAIAELYQLRLETDGYVVETARDGEAGLAQATDNPPDLIFLDLRLPGLSGIDLLQRLRANPTTTDIPVVIVTNYDEPELRTKGLSLGALEFLVKADMIPARLTQSAERWTAKPQQREAPPR